MSADDFSRQDIAYHRATAASYDQDVTDVFAIYHRHLLDPFLDLVGGALEHVQALDLGCGTGAVTVALATRGFEVIGVDHSTEMLAIAEEKLEKLTEATSSGKFKLMTADVRELPFATAEFDCVTCQGLLHHLEEVRPSLAELARVLKPGGYFYISEPCVNQTPLKRIGARIWHVLRRRRLNHPIEVPESIEAPVDAADLRAALDDLGLSYEVTFLSHFAPLRSALSDQAYLRIVRALSYPWRRTRGDLLFIFGRKAPA